MKSKLFSTIVKALSALLVAGAVVFGLLQKISQQGVEAVAQEAVLTLAAPQGERVTVAPLEAAAEDAPGSATVKTQEPPVIAPMDTEEAAIDTAAAPTTQPTRTKRPPAATKTPTADLPLGNGFDFYILTLSWSPDYCATSGQDDQQQCKIGRKLGFVLHGLWPQYERGYPSYCSDEQMTQEVKQQFPGLYPSSSLYDHEWEKHGTCTGLMPLEYLTLSKQLKERVVIPDVYRAPEKPLRVTVKQMEQEMVSANPGFDERSFAVFCSGSGRYLKQMYVCFTLAGMPTPCSAEVDRDAARSCQAKDFLVRNVK